MRFKKGELSFYLNSKPQELRDYLKTVLKDHKRNGEGLCETEEHINYFWEKYDYSYTKQKWIKK